MNAILYFLRAGMAWRLLPHDLPPWQTAYYYRRRWQREGVQAQQFTDLTALLAANGRAQTLREAERAAAADHGREQRQRFLAPGAGYQPGNARMFNN